MKKTIAEKRWSKGPVTFTGWTGPAWENIKKEEAQPFLFLAKGKACKWPQEDGEDLLVADVMKWALGFQAARDLAAQLGLWGEITKIGDICTYVQVEVEVEDDGGWDPSDDSMGGGYSKVD